MVYNKRTIVGNGTYDEEKVVACESEVIELLVAKVIDVVSCAERGDRCVRTFVDRRRSGTAGRRCACDSDASARRTVQTASRSRPRRSRTASRPCEFSRAP